MKKIFIFIDDERTISQVYGSINEDFVLITCRDIVSAISAIKWFSDINEELYISFDHDLGTKLSGYDIAKFLIENNIKAKYHVHSMNIVGKINIQDLLNHYGYKDFL